MNKILFILLLLIPIKSFSNDIVWSAYIKSTRYVDRYFVDKHRFVYREANPQIISIGNTYTISYYFNVYGRRNIQRVEYTCRMRYDGLDYRYRYKWKLIWLVIDGKKVY